MPARPDTGRRRGPARPSAVEEGPGRNDENLTGVDERMRPDVGPADGAGPTADGSTEHATAPSDAQPEVAQEAVVASASSDENGVEGRSAGATAPQLRRFIKSRSYVPMHELRRRFGINGADDDVTAVDMHGTAIYVGLPPREGRLLGELLRGGEVGYELSHDPSTPVVVGVYPMRPVPRH